MCVVQTQSVQNAFSIRMSPRKWDDVSPAPLSEKYSDLKNIFFKRIAGD